MGCMHGTIVPNERHAQAGANKQRGGANTNSIADPSLAAPLVAPPLPPSADIAESSPATSSCGGWCQRDKERCIHLQRKGLGLQPCPHSVHTTSRIVMHDAMHSAFVQATARIYPPPTHTHTHTPHTHKENAHPTTRHATLCLHTPQPGTLSGTR